MRTKEAVLNEVAKKKDTDPLASAHTFIEDYAGGSCGYYRDDVVEAAMFEYAKEVSLKFSEYWGQITPEQLQYFIIEKGTPEPIVQYKTREEVFDEWISKYLQETSSLK